MVRISKQSTVERRMNILKLLSENQQVFVQELSSRFGVSEVTIRNDLEQLELKKLLVRARGGAMNVEHVVSYDQQLGEKHKINMAEKGRIGKAAARLIKDSDTIIVDSGTTTLEVIKNIPESIVNLTVITNALNIANHLIASPHLSLIIPGGVLRKNSLSLIGPLAERNFKNFYVDKVFLGVDGFDTRTGISTPNMEEAYLNQIMIDIAREVIVVTDSSKFHRKSLAFICANDRIDTVVTDSGISDEDKKRLEDAGIQVIVA
ncbi:MAG TPA: transcriptional repressor AgaR [Bacteroidales bacterium]|nr:transcriptional repressor AgaR [Bacteroidales bacterium]